MTHHFGPELFTVEGGHTPEVEALRAIAGQIVTEQVQRGRRGLVVCGPALGVGVTFIATNLAVMLARHGVSTLLVEANLHEPDLQKIIIPSGEPLGLQQLLRGEVERPEILHHEVLENLSVIYGGGATTEASELLGLPAFEQLIGGCLRDFDFTLIDSPPANRSSDLCRISALVGYNLIVARDGVSFTDDVSTLAQDLADGGARVVGALLNRP